MEQGGLSLPGSGEGRGNKEDQAPGTRHLSSCSGGLQHASISQPTQRPCNHSSLLTDGKKVSASHAAGRVMGVQDGHQKEEGKDPRLDQKFHAALWSRRTAGECTTRKHGEGAKQGDFHQRKPQARVGWERPIVPDGGSQLSTVKQILLEILDQTTKCR